MKNSTYKLQATILRGKSVRFRYTVINAETNQPLTHEFKGAQTPNIRDDKRAFIAMTIDTMTCFSTQRAIDKYLAMAAKKNPTITNPNWLYETEIAYLEVVEPATTQK
jgi:hypothetical protein